MSALQNKIDFVAFLSVKRANPNGDPLSGNRPRVDTKGIGFMTGECVKRKIRNRMQDLGYPIFVQSADRCDDGKKSLKERADALLKNEKDQDRGAKAACAAWLDVRSFGQVFAFSNNEEKKGSGVSISVRGPVTVCDAVSVSPVDVESVGGVCDVVEFRCSPQGVPLRGREGLWLPTPVEYKRGRPKEDDRDEGQLCGQALCLEDMLACSIPQAFLYYGEPRRRQTVPLTDELRKRVLDIAAEMRALSARGYTPSVRPSKACNACSLKEICLPHLSRSGSVAAYIHARAGEEP